MRNFGRLSLSVIILSLSCASFVSAYSGGTGDTNTPYQIATKADLLALAANTGDYGKCFILTADIDMGGQVFTTAIIAANTSSSYPHFEGTRFTGIFDGSGHKITGFTINGGNSFDIGLFGQIYFGGSVKNLGLENFSVSGAVDVGGLVGESWGIIENCYSTGQATGGSGVGDLLGGAYGTVSNCYSTGQVSGDNQYAGGLAGQASGGSISNCYSTGVVNGDMYVGGLLGGAYSTVRNCYSTGQVSGSFQDIGGLVGYNSGSISNCYSTGAVSGSYGVIGGLVGQNWEGIISNCYSTGHVDDSSCCTGGLVGENYNGGIWSSFWDTQTSGIAITSAGGTGMTTAQMKTLSTFTSAGWDFVTIWAICEGTNYPRFVWQIPAGDWVCPDGVNFADFTYFADRWLTTGCDTSNNFCGGADMDTSGAVDMADFAIFADNWLEGI